MHAWYLLYCKAKNESRAEQNLHQQGIKTYLPMFKLRKVKHGNQLVEETPLFPNYLFAKFDPEIFSVSKIKSTRGVSQIVDCREQMTPLCALVDAIKRQELALATAAGDKLSEQQISQDLQAGERVRFVNGPFVDLEGVFEQKSGTKRCYVLMKVLGKIQSMKVPIEQITHA